RVGGFLGFWNCQNRFTRRRGAGFLRVSVSPCLRVTALRIARAPRNLLRTPSYQSRNMRTKANFAPSLSSYSPLRRIFLLLGAALLLSRAAMAAQATDAPTLTIHRAAGPITIDGDLSDPGW